MKGCVIPASHADTVNAHDIRLFRYQDEELCMSEDIILVNHHEAAQIEHEEKTIWLRGIFEKIGIPLGFWPENPTMKDLRKMRGVLLAEKIEIIDDNNSGLEVYFDGDLIAEWRKPFYKLKRDPNIIDPRYRVYLEMHLRRRSVFDKSDNTGDQ